MKNRRRKGTVLIVALVAMIVCTSILLTVMSSSLRSRTQLRNELQMVQTHWVLDAAIRRGMGQWEADRDYIGESFEIAPGIGDYASVNVVIDVEIDTQTGERVLGVTAEIGDKKSIAPVTRRSKKVRL